VLTLTLIGIGTKVIGLKNYETERRFYDTWKELHDKASFGKKFRVKTDSGDTFEADVMQIKNCVYEEMEYVEPEVMTEETIQHGRK